VALQARQRAQLLPPSERPQWDGSPIKDGSLLLIADQGMATSFSSPLHPMGRARCARLAIACSAELPPSSNTGGLPASVRPLGAAPEFTAYCALSGLRGWPAPPRDDPGRDPYARADPARRRLWPSGFRLAATQLSPIGIVWAGRSDPSQ